MDDSASIRESYRDSLDAEGFAVAKGGNGADALFVLER